MDYHKNRRDSGFDNGRRDSDVSVASSIRSQVLTKNMKLVRQTAINGSIKENRRASLPNIREPRDPKVPFLKDDDGLVTRDDYFYTMECGKLKGNLSWKRFYCPGINNKCIKLESGEWLTPKEVVVRGEKESLKDWKRAIKIEGTAVRTLLERNLLDYRECWKSE